MQDIALQTVWQEDKQRKETERREEKGKERKMSVKWAISVFKSRAISLIYIYIYIYIYIFFFFFIVKLIKKLYFQTLECCSFNSL